METLKQRFRPRLRPHVPQPFRHLAKGIGLAPQARCGRSPEIAEAGFTLLELLVVLVLIGVLASIAAPVWLSFIDSQRLGQAQDGAFRALRDAQAKGRQRKRVWETCFRDRNNQVEYSVHPRVGTGGCDNASWQPLLAEASGTAGVAIDAANTTLARKGDAYRMQFQDNGWANGQLGRVTFQLRGRNDTRRSCTFVSTLLGALRGDSDKDCLK